MKTLEKSTINKLPKADIVIDNDKYAFLDGMEMFAKKNAEAKAFFANVKLPPR
jgi:hypothetical protein